MSDTDSRRPDDRGVRLRHCPCPPIRRSFLKSRSRWVRLAVWLVIIVVTAGATWQRDRHVLLTNFHNMYNPCVVETAGDYRYKMWFFGWAIGLNPGVPGCDAIFHARSKDLRSWEVYSRSGTWDKTMDPTRWVPVVHASTRWYEAWHVGDPSVVSKDGRFYMAYSATSKVFAHTAGYPSDMVQCVMGAVSLDGIHWTKSTRPLLIRASDRVPPKPEPDRTGDFHRPSLSWDRGKWQLWFDYHLADTGICMGHAENTGEFLREGGFRITHDLRKPLLKNWPNPEVVRLADGYHCFSDPRGYAIKPGQSGWMSRQLREAVSADGLTWRKLDYIPPDADADACHVPQTLVTKINGQKWLYLFYATQVGYKKHDGQYHFEYDRIRAMRRPLDGAHP